MKKDKIRKYPEEQLLMMGCPNCGQEVNKQYVEHIIDNILEKERKSILHEVKHKIKELERDI